jgi:hypothetical protein
VIISDNSNRLFISALPGQISQPDGHILFASLSGGGSARAIANLPLAKTLHLDLTVSAKTLNVDCSPKE